MASYSFADILAAYQEVGVGPGMTIYVAADILKVADYSESGGSAVIDAHFRALTELIGESGTLVVSTASMYLCNTDQPFDIDKTPSRKTGAFSEYVRLQPGAVRSRHPYVSYTALGPKAAEITGNVSRHCYGPETPESRMADLDALKLSVGLPPHMSCSTVHHVEQIMAVPYRYTKEYVHPMVTGGSIVNELFYMYVWYRDIGIVRDKNVKLFERLKGRLDIGASRLGRTSVYSYRLGAFIKESCKIFADDIYVWSKTLPDERPYRN